MSVPWLADLPPRVCETLDRTEFAPHHPKLATLRADLEARTGHLVMTYRLAPSPPRPGTRTLCQLIEAADLTAADTAVLSAAEDRTREFGACLVAYRNPLALKAGALDPFPPPRSDKIT
ncbi:MAG: hypothetical protein ACRDXX_17410 [Stackebrandtia sp.]